jgi:hypothetical protein
VLCVVYYVYLFKCVGVSKCASVVVDTAAARTMTQAEKVLEEEVAKVRDFGPICGNVFICVCRCMGRVRDGGRGGKGGCD